MDISDITASDLEDDIIAPTIIEEYREQMANRIKDDGYLRILAIFVISVYQEFESFLRIEADLVEDDIKLVMNEYNCSFFITYELEPGIYTLKIFPKLC